MKQKVYKILTVINNFEHAVREHTVIGVHSPERTIIYEQHYLEMKSDLLQAIIDFVPDEVFDS